MLELAETGLGGSFASMRPARHYPLKHRWITVALGAGRSMFRQPIRYFAFAMGLTDAVGHA
jgi:hypothetical protein